MLYNVNNLLIEKKYQFKLTNITRLNNDMVRFFMEVLLFDLKW